MDPLSACHLPSDNGEEMSQLTTWFLLDGSEQEFFTADFFASCNLTSSFQIACPESSHVGEAPSTFGYHYHQQQCNDAEYTRPPSLEVAHEQVPVDEGFPCFTSENGCNDMEYGSCKPFRFAKADPDSGLIKHQNDNSVPECTRVFPPGFRYNVVTRPTYRKLSTDSAYASSDNEDSTHNSSMEFCEGDGALQAVLKLSDLTTGMIRHAQSQAKASDADGYGYPSSSGEHDGVTNTKLPTLPLNNTYRFSGFEDEVSPMIDSKEHSSSWNSNLSYQSPLCSPHVSMCTSPAVPYSPVCGTQQHHLDETLLPSSSTGTELSATRRPQSSNSESRADTVGNCCRNGGCGQSLEGAKAYHQRYRLCKGCIGKLTLNIDGETKRFCQQCSLVHPIAKFDGVKKSCRDRLAVHALRLKRRREASRLRK